MAWQDDIGSREVIVLRGALQKDDGSDFTDDDVDAFLALLAHNGLSFGGGIGFLTTAEAAGGGDSDGD